MTTGNKKMAYLQLQTKQKCRTSFIQCKNKSSEYEYLFFQLYLLTGTSIRGYHSPDANQDEVAVKRCDHTESITE